MRRGSRGRIIAFFIFIFSLQIPGQSQNLYDLQHSLDYATHLMNKGKYEFAAREWERIYYSEPGYDSVKINLLKAYRKAGLIERGRERALQLLDNTALRNRPFCFEYMHLLMLDTAHQQLLDFVNTNTHLSYYDQFFTRVTVRLLQQKWGEAQQSLNQQDTLSHKAYQPYYNLTQQALNRSTRSPTLAVAMSAVVPGLGKVYTNNWRDGLFAFFIVGISAYQAYKGFNKVGVKSTHAWLFSSIGFSFYLGNLYGSAKSAQIFNRRVNKTYTRKAKKLWRSNVK